jgi:Protein of unknown function (DUF3617)
MKTVLVAGTSLLIAAFFQAPPAIAPMKLGLWETTSNMKMSGVQMPQGMTMPGSMTKVRSCLTQESWTKNLGASQRAQNCTRSNEVFTSTRYAFDMSCPANGMTGHFEMTFESKDNGHGVMHMNIDRGGHAMTMDSTIETRFISADCGGVTPDKPEIVK